MMGAVGLHIRLPHTLADLAQKAVRLHLSIFQCFFRQQATGKPFLPSEQDVRVFLAHYRHQFDQLYLHGSYLINLASVHCINQHILRRELALARQLSFTHIIVHPGSAKGAQTREQGLDALARALNSILRYERALQIVLENVAFGKMVIGGDLQDFKLLLEKIDKPDKLSFCIDTAHAHSFGYNLIDESKREQFIQELDDTIGVERIALLHLNDTQEICGSRIDHHAILGQGNLGRDGLCFFMTHPQLAHIPVVLELPEMPEQQEVALIQEVASWRMTMQDYQRKEKEYDEHCDQRIWAHR